MESLESRLFRVNKTLLTMLRDREYLVSAKELDAPLEEFKSKSRVDMTRLLRKRNDP